MKKTLLVTLDFHPTIGGVSRYWKFLSQEMPSDHWAVLAPPLPHGVKELSCSYRIYRRAFLSQICLPCWLPLVLALIEIILRERPRAIIVGQILPVGTAVYLVTRIFRIPYIVSTHGMDVALPFSHSTKKNLCSRIFSHAKKIITVSQYTAKKIQEYGVAKDKIEFIYPCPIIRHSDVMSVFPHSKKEYILLTVARLVKRKGHEHVLSALAQLHTIDSPVYYVIAGAGPEKDALMQKTSELGLSDRVIFTGELTDAAISQWYRKCDIFIMAPYEINGDVEGFGIVYLEANTFGKPVIGTLSGGVEDAVENGVTGLLVEPQNPRLLAQAIETLLSDETLRHRLGEQGKQRVEKQFQWHVQAEKLKYFIENDI